MKIQINKCYLVSTPVQGTNTSAQVLAERILHLEIALTEKSALIKDIYHDSACPGLAPALIARIRTALSR